MITVYLNISIIHFPTRCEKVSITRKRAAQFLSQKKLFQKKYIRLKNVDFD